MPNPFAKPLEICSLQLGDTLTFTVDELTPFEPELTITDLDGNIEHGPVAPSLEREGKLYWFVDASIPFGMGTAKQYHIVSIDDDITGYDSTRFMVYVNDHKNFEDYLIRALGLSGHNMRIFNHVWTRGLLADYEIKTYHTTADLESAEAGGSDNFITHYRVTRRFNSVHNNFETISTRLA